MPLDNLARDLFGRAPAPVPMTEGVKYAGSKKKLLPHILQLVGSVSPRRVLDGFSGSTRVSQAFAKSGYDVVSNDIAAWSEVFATCYLKGGEPQRYAELIEHLNGLAPRDGWFTVHYGGLAEGSSKRPWQLHNTRKLDAIRAEIDALRLSAVDRAVALTSLILALDKVDSTLGHQASYLREWSARSYLPLTLKVPSIVPGSGQHEVLRRDIFDVAATADVDVAYYDPPYGSNNEKMPPSRVRYSAYYHLWTTVCLNDEPELFGKANRRSDTRDTANPSIFEEYRKGECGRFLAVEAVERLIRVTIAPLIVLSYSSGGRATAAELHDAISAVGKVLDVIEVDYKENVMAGMTWTKEWLREAAHPHREFLFLIQKRA